jgi:hypothetical protein
MMDWLGAEEKIRQSFSCFLLFAAPLKRLIRNIFFSLSHSFAEKSFNCFSLLLGRGQIKAATGGAKRLFRLAQAY